jgi:hypothetical protein
MTRLRSRVLRIAAEGVALAALLVAMVRDFERRLDAPLTEPDEAAWIFAGYYFQLYFAQGGLAHADWSDYDALDHPPLAKYVIGAATSAAGHPVETLEAKRSWHAMPLGDFVRRLPELAARVPSAALRAGRGAAFACTLLAFALLYFFLRRRAGVLCGLAALALCFANDQVRETACQAVADPMLLACLAGFALALARYHRTRSAWDAGLASAIAALAFLTKLSGLILLPVLLLDVAVGTRRDGWRRSLGAALGSLAVFAALSLLLNPTFFNYGPDAVVEMFRHRAAQVSAQQQAFPLAALHGLGERLAAFFEVVFFVRSSIYQATGVPLELCFFLLGIYAAVRRRDAFLLGMLVVLVLVPALALPLKWPRYYFTIAPFTAAVGGGSLALLRDLRAARREAAS